ncbi:MAG: fatty acid desaturase [Candidatus Binatia bacterium]
MSQEFSAPELRRRFANTFSPNPLLYWSDLFVSASIGWGAFTLAAKIPPGAFLQLMATVIAVCALLRAAIFIHEIAHLRDGSLPGFGLVWNLVVGFPFLLPSLMYVGSHNGHHRQSTFGTAHDPEYAPIARWSRRRILWFVVSVVFVPALLVVRWGILGPLSFFIPPLRRWLIARASTLVINADYRRPVPKGKQATRWVIQELAVTLMFWGVLVCMSQGWISSQWLVQWYVVAAGMLMVNQLRTLAAHRYDNDGSQLDAAAQLVDSVTLNGWVFPTVLAAPVGLRFHALHHVLPTVPYHSLGVVHRLLLAELPPDSLYRRTQERRILAVVTALLRQPRASAPPLTADRVVREV